jgi:VanZ family protein
VLAAGLSLSVEIAQNLLPSRVPSGLDFVSNSAGGCLGAVAAALMDARLKLRRGASGWRFSGAALLLACWTLYQVYPLVPITLVRPLVEKLRGVAAGDAVALPIGIAEWLAVAALARAAVGERSAQWAVPALALLVPARLLLRWRALTWPELAAVAAALVLLSVPAAPALRRPRTLAALLAAAIVLDAVWPFRFTAAAQPFEWRPLAFVRSETVYGPVALLQKSFRYGALLWLLRVGGAALPLAGASAAAGLCVMEAAQRHMPGRHPDITDPLLAVMLAGLLYALERRDVSDSAERGRTRGPKR